MKKRTAAMFLAVLMLLGLMGCGGGNEETETPEPPPVEEPAPEPEPEPEPVDPTKLNPLNGELMDKDYRNLRPVAVMFNNLREAQPQLGISQADLIYEIPAEGGITRMVGVYQSLEGVGTLGSIRSTRSYYLEVALGMTRCWSMPEEVRMRIRISPTGTWIIWTVCGAAVTPRSSGGIRNAAKPWIMSIPW